VICNVSRDPSVSVKPNVLASESFKRKGGKAARQPHPNDFTSTIKLSPSHNGVRVESIRSHVCCIVVSVTLGCKSIHLLRFRANKCLNSYNKYLSVAARVVRRSLKEDKRLQAERRGEMELRFAKWTVSGVVLVLLVVEEGILANWAIDTERKARREQELSGCQCCCYGGSWVRFIVVDAAHCVRYLGYRRGTEEVGCRRLVQLHHG
jgi:hypothetical protein